MVLIVPPWLLQRARAMPKLNSGDSCPASPGSLSKFSRLKSTTVDVTRSGDGESSGFSRAPNMGEATAEGDACWGPSMGARPASPGSLSKFSRLKLTVDVLRSGDGDCLEFSRAPNMGEATAEGDACWGPTSGARYSGMLTVSPACLVFSTPFCTTIEAAACNRSSGDWAWSGRLRRGGIQYIGQRGAHQTRGA